MKVVIIRAAVRRRSMTSTTDITLCETELAFLSPMYLIRILRRGLQTFSMSSDALELIIYATAPVLFLGLSFNNDSWPNILPRLPSLPHFFNASTSNSREHLRDSDMCATSNTILLY